MPRHRGAHGTRRLTTSTAQLLHRDTAEEPSSPCLAPRLASPLPCQGWGGLEEMPSGCRLLPAPRTQRPGPPGRVSALTQRRPRSPVAAKGGCGAGHTPSRKGERKKEIQVTPNQALPRLRERGFSSALRFSVVQGEVKQLWGAAAPKQAGCPCRSCARSASSPALTLSYPQLETALKGSVAPPAMGERGLEMSLYGRRCGAQLSVSPTVPSPCSGTGCTSPPFRRRWGLTALLRCRVRDPQGSGDGAVPGARHSREHCLCQGDTHWG